MIYFDEADFFFFGTPSYDFRRHLATFPLLSERSWVCRAAGHYRRPVRVPVRHGTWRTEHGIVVSRKLTLPYSWWHRIPTPYKTVSGVTTFALFLMGLSLLRRTPKTCPSARRSSESSPVDTLESQRFIDSILSTPKGATDGPRQNYKAP